MSPFFAACGMASVLLAFLAGLYWAEPARSHDCAVFHPALGLDHGDAHPMFRPITPSEAEKRLQIQTHARHGPGWWATAFTLGADGTFFASLLSGYLYLWTIAPNWPPETSRHGRVRAAAVMALALILPAGFCTLVNPRHRPQRKPCTRARDCRYDRPRRSE